MYVCMYRTSKGSTCKWHVGSRTLGMEACMSYRNPRDNTMQLLGGGGLEMRHSVRASSGPSAARGTDDDSLRRGAEPHRMLCADARESSGYAPGTHRAALCLIRTRHAARAVPVHTAHTCLGDVEGRTVVVVVMVARQCSSPR